MRFRLPVGVAYGSDVNKVREALIAAAREHSATLEDPEPTAFLEKFGDSTIDFEVIAWSRKMSHSPRRFRSDLNYLITNISPPLASRFHVPNAACISAAGRCKVENVTKRESTDASEARL